MFIPDMDIKYTLTGLALLRYKNLAAVLGFEPRQTTSKAVVLTSYTIPLLNLVGVQGLEP